MRSTIALMLALALPATAAAGTYEATHVAGATEPNTFRVEISMTADLAGQCPDFTCAWCCTGHSVRITPAPVAIAPWMINYGTDPNVFSWDMSDPDGTGTYWVDLDVATVTDFTAQATAALWHGLGTQGCDPSLQCYRRDENFPALQIAGPAVASTASSWSSLKIRF